MTFPIRRRFFCTPQGYPPCQGLVETYCEKNEETEPSLFSAIPTWNYFHQAIKEQYYHVGSYGDKYIQWTYDGKGIKMCMS